MGHSVALNSYISLGGTVVSGDGFSIQAAHSTDLPEDTSFGDTFKQRLIGLQDYQLSLEFHNDYADDAFDEDIEALVATSFATSWRPDTGAIASDNPEYQFTGAISSLSKSHGIGEKVTVSLTIMISTSAGVTRDITP